MHRDETHIGVWLSFGFQTTQIESGVFDAGTDGLIV